VDERFQPLAELAVHGANVQPGQIVAVGATIGQHDLARVVAGAAYRRGALFVDVVYFDPYVKRERIANADPESLGYVLRGRSRG
jgi:aminopeptidase